jgi:hypothetical protein
LQYSDVPEDIEPEEIRPMGNYAVSINWPDGFSQVNIHIRFNNFIKKESFKLYIITIFIPIDFCRKSISIFTLLLLK